MIIGIIRPMTSINTSIMNNSIIQTGDIVLVPFPFTNLKSKKTRPAIVIYTEEQNQDYILVGITSHSHKQNEVQITNKNLQIGRLPVTSYVRYTKITTLHNSLIIKSVAKLNQETTKQILNKIRTLFV